MKASIISLFSLCAALVQSQDRDMIVEGCSGRNFQGHCESFSCAYQGCCPLPHFFRENLVSVRSIGPYNFRLYTDAGCAYSCAGHNDESLFVDSEGWSNIGAAAYACINGPS